ncbi:MAG TPA: hypothetical protein VK629_11815, partial [Steroidobacteraceae bacterium]|nr:hypothetical protein [Steroidobacteraceae bacterium]
MNSLNSLESRVAEKLLTSRRSFLRMATTGALVAQAATPIARAASTDKTTDLIYMSATKLAEMIRAKKVSALEAVNAYIDRQLSVN